MDKVRVYGNTTLNGEVIISGSKNSALSILFASILTKEPIEIKNVPKLKDIDVAILILNKLGIKIIQNHSIFIHAQNINNFYTPNKIVKNIRASILLLGSLLARCGKCKIFLPGGCNIGKRPVDIHINELKKLGANITLKKGCINAFVSKKLVGTTIIMNKISVGATLNIINASILAHGTTTIYNAAQEPEILDTSNFLIQLGAKIIGAGSNKIIIEGVEKLKGGVYKILPDRIETATFLIAAVISRGNIICKNSCPNILKIVLSKLQQTGADIKYGKNWISLNMHNKRPKSVNIITAPYPGFPTDIQPQFSLLNIISKGIGTITETIFENRFMHILEMKRMGAKVKINKNTITCYGINKLIGTKVIATDLRSSASLVLAGCIAEGITIIHNINYIDRGYDNIENKLRLLGVKIERTQN